MLLALTVALATAAAPGPTLFETTFRLAQAGEATATIAARCTPCAWDTRGREGASLMVLIDGRYSQHVILFRGQEPAEYRLSLGRLDSGDHRIRIALDIDWTPRGVSAAVDEARIDVPESSAEQVALAHAPILHARADTVDRFTDVPLISWYETDRGDGLTHLRYGVVFSNEDGGTPTDRLMATWGRTTDIEYVYWVEVDDTGNVRSAGFEGAGHQIRSFAGTREDRHPLLWVATLNNMISDAGTTEARFRPAPFGFDLKNASREAVMDARPWTYGVMAREIVREGKVTPTARPGSGEIPDPRRFVYVEVCGELTDAAVAFAIGAFDGRGATQWFTSDAGMRDFRIARSGCFRAAIALPADIDGTRLATLRVTAFPHQPQAGAAPPGDAPSARITRVNRLFMLNDEYVPGPSRLTWDGDVLLTADRPSWTIRLPPPSASPLPQGVDAPHARATRREIEKEEAVEDRHLAAVFDRPESIRRV